MTFDSTVDVQMERVYREEEKNFNQPGRTSYFTTGCWYGESQVYKDEETIYLQLGAACWYGEIFTKMKKNLQTIR